MSCGWTRTSETEYPRYESLRSEFTQLALDLAAFVAEDNIQVVELGMTYVNEFVLDVDNPLDALSTAFCVRTERSRFENLPSLASAGANFRFDFTNAQDRYARLVASSRVWSEGAESKTQFRLRYFGDPFAAPGAENLDGFDSILSFYDQGHAAIVQAFAQTTDPKMHLKWERVDRVS
jgi:hypothetical protein